MTETNKKTAPRAETFTPDLSTPLASAMNLWQGELSRFFELASKNLDQSLAVQRKLVDEHARFAEAQMSATQDAMRLFADGVQKVGSASTSH